MAKKNKTTTETTDEAGDYADILTQSWDDIPEPRDTPEGSWRLKNKAAKFSPAVEADEDNGIKGRSAMVNFVDEPIEPMDDVDAAALEAAGDYDWAQNASFYQMWLKDTKDWAKLRAHLALRGVDVTGSSIQDSLKAVKNTTVIAVMKERTYKNKAGDFETQVSPVSFAKDE